MTGQLIAALALLVVPAILPSLALLGPRPVTVFMTPLIGSVLAALAAELEIVLGSTLLTWYVLMVIAVNAIALGRLWQVYGEGPHPTVPDEAASKESRRRNGFMSLRPSWWSSITVILMTLGVLWPLQALRAPIIAYDGYAIWTLHSLFIYGGHEVFRADLTNPVYRFSNPNYPPLVSASGALGFVADGMVNLRIAVVLTSVLNASALASLGCAVAATASSKDRTWARIPALLAGASLCLIGFGLSGVYGVGGYADLLWSASAAAAVILGLVLPRSGPNLAAAWVCATVTGLSKNEGFVTACLVLVLLAMRYIRTPRRSTPAPSGGSRLTRYASGWPGWALRVAVLVVLMSIPSLSWALYARYDRLRSDFVGASDQLLSTRFHATAAAVSDNLHVVPLAIGVAVIGAVVLRRTRRRLTLGNDVWAWLVIAGSLGALLMTYVFGAPEIHWWLSTSANRTTIFENLALYCDMAVWLIVALSARTAELPPGASGGTEGSDQRREEPNDPASGRERPAWFSLQYILDDDRPHGHPRDAPDAGDEPVTLDPDRALPTDA